MPRSATHVDKIIGGRLKLARKNAKLSQTELGKVINASFQQIQKYERGANRVSSAALVTFAQCLDVPITYFFEGLAGLASHGAKKKKEASDSFDKFARSSQAEQLLRRFHALRRDKERKLVLDLLDTLN